MEAEQQKQSYKIRVRHILSEECVSPPNKPSFSLLWLVLQLFPVQSQEPSPRDSFETWEVTVLSCPTLFPARA